MILTSVIYDNVLNYFKNNIENKLVQIETITSKSIDRLVNFETFEIQNNGWPFAVLFGETFQFSAGELDTDKRTLEMIIEINDSRLDTAQLKYNLLSYADAMKEMIQDDISLDGNAIQSYVNEIIPPLVLKIADNYTGAIAVKITIEIE